MKIDKNSLHYRLYSLYKSEQSYKNDMRHAKTENICPYIRGVLRGLLVCMGIVITLTFFIILLAEPPLTLGVYLFTGNFIGGVIQTNLTTSSNLLIGGTLFYGLFTSIALIQLGKYIIDEVDDYRRANNNYQSYVDKPAGIFKIINEYIKSKHDKFCPTIELVNSNKSDEL